MIAQRVLKVLEFAHADNMEVEMNFGWSFLRKPNALWTTLSERAK